VLAAAEAWTPMSEAERVAAASAMADEPGIFPIPR
jgi:hypothetical protein